MGYAKSEQETNLNFDYETGEWTVYSTIPKHIRKIQELTDVTILEQEDGRPIAMQGKLSEKQVSMKKLRVMSDEQKEKAAQRLKKAREN